MVSERLARYGALAIVAAVATGAVAVRAAPAQQAVPAQTAATPRADSARTAPTQPAASGTNPTTGTTTCGQGDDEVVCTFQKGDTRAPVVIGPLYNGSDRPPTSQGSQTSGTAQANVAPVAQTHVLRVAILDGHPQIDWQPAPGIVGYDVLRTTVNPAGWVVLRQAISSPTQFIDQSVSGPVAGSYIYRLIVHCASLSSVYADIRLGAAPVAIPVCR